jgi:single-strand DNA-binding protein
MSHIISGIYRVGRDAELRHVPTGEAVVNLSVVTNYGRKDANGDKPSVWIDAGLWGKTAEALTPYLLKGKQVFLTMKDLHLEEFTNREGLIRTKLVARVQSIELVGSRMQGDQEPEPDTSELHDVGKMD